MSQQNKTYLRKGLKGDFMSKWCRKYKGDLQCKKYMVTCFVLMDEIDGYFEGKYEIAIHSWHADYHNPRFKVADSFSKYRYKMEFDNKKDANAVWSWIKSNEPTYKELEKIGFTKSVW